MRKKTNGVAGSIIIQLNMIQLISSEQWRFPLIIMICIELFQALESGVSKLA